MHAQLRGRWPVLASGAALLLAILALARISEPAADHAGLAIALVSLLAGLACAPTFSRPARLALACALVAAAALAILHSPAWIPSALAVALAWLVAVASLAALAWRPAARLPNALAGAAAAILACGSTALLASGLPALLTPALPESSPGTGSELHYLALTDQADRSSAAMLLDGSRDRRRLARVLEFDAQGAIRDPRAAADAALVLLHGRCPAHFSRAAELFRFAAAAAVAGAEEGHRPAVDRHLLSIGELQRYGTQGLQTADLRCPP